MYAVKPRTFKVGKAGVVPEVERRERLRKGWG